MRILEKLKIPFEVKTYECDEFVDGMHIADQLGQPYEQSFKTLVMQGKSKEYYVFVLPVDKEVELKKGSTCCRGKIACDGSRQRHSGSYRLYQGRLYIDWHEEEIPYRYS